MVNERSRQLHQPRLAEIVADDLRQRILEGKLKDGEFLPNQEQLISEFHISMPSLREALRMLETEGLITVRRGNVGGALVHRPETRHAAYTLALVLQGRHVGVDDVAVALRELESTCAGLCALREDRLVTVVPVLKEWNDKSRDVLDDHLAYVQVTAEFHRSLVTFCGNDTMQIIAGAVETLWLSHVQEWAETTAHTGTSPDRNDRLVGLRIHERITSLIERGASTQVIALVRDHLDPTRFYNPEDSRPRLVTASMLRSPGRVFGSNTGRATI